MEDFMIDTCNNSSYYLKLDELDYIANVTGSFFEDDVNGKQIQTSDLDVELNFELSDCYAQIYQIDTGGFSVNSKAKDILIENCVPFSSFRKMKVEGQYNLLHQFVAESHYLLIKNDSSYKVDCFRGVLDFERYLILSDYIIPIGTICGREDYQEIFVNDKIYKLLCALDTGVEFIQVPVLNNYLIEFLKGGNIDVLHNSEILNDSYISLLPLNVLLDLMKKFKSAEKIELVSLLFDNLKQRRNIPFNIKKEAMIIYKSSSL